MRSCASGERSLHEVSPPRLLCFVSLVVPSDRPRSRGFHFYQLRLDMSGSSRNSSVWVCAARLRCEMTQPLLRKILRCKFPLRWIGVRFKIAGTPVEFVASRIHFRHRSHRRTVRGDRDLPHELPPKGTIDLDVGYEGVIPLDVTRLDANRRARRQGQAHGLGPDQQVIHRGARNWICGLVSGCDGGSELVGREQRGGDDGRWNARFASATMSLMFESTVDVPIFFTGTPNGLRGENANRVSSKVG